MSGVASMGELRRWSIFQQESGADREYFDAVDRLMRTPKSDILANSHAGHALYALRRFTEASTREIRIYTGNLKQYSERLIDDGLPLYSDPFVLEALKRFLTRSTNCNLNIVLEGELDGDLEGADIHPVIKMVNDLQATGDFRGSFRLSQLSSSYAEELSERQLNQHLMLFDDKFGRIEFDAQQAAAALLFHKNDMIAGFSQFFDAKLADSDKSTELVHCVCNSR